ncbi:glucosamine-6-phosphate deaminase [Natranaerobius trueperi]|uniref:Glucosamine-6-phosphate deaminase n=1 Tax=Natranaerobius trueperi TaxID=759412 RepID=A0A226C1J9_9FIRM|nr:glucosamine-6-phosphate deaminase [Natranaerobius trueperi]
MKLITVNDYEELSRLAAEYIKAQLLLKANSNLGLATGMTPMGMYENLVKMYQNGEVSFKEATTFNLDEFLGISPSSPVSYYSYMMENLFNHIDIKKENINIPLSNPENEEKACNEYENKVVKKGIDLQILGIGTNGHIGFNEPGEELNDKTHVTNLKEETIKQNEKLLVERGEESAYHIPKRALTMGMGTILKADKIILLANGSNKKEIVSKMLHHNINTNLPATFLKLHKDVTVILDKESSPF